MSPSFCDNKENILIAEKSLHRNKLLNFSHLVIFYFMLVVRILQSHCISLRKTKQRLINNLETVNKINRLLWGKNTHKKLTFWWFGVSQI